MGRWETGLHMKDLVGHHNDIGHWDNGHLNKMSNESFPWAQESHTLVATALLSLSARHPVFLSPLLPYQLGVFLSPASEEASTFWRPFSSFPCCFSLNVECPLQANLVSLEDVGAFKRWDPVEILLSLWKCPVGGLWDAALYIRAPTPRPPHPALPYLPYLLIRCPEAHSCH